MISSDDSRLNEILSRCQVKKTLNLETNISVAYATDDRAMHTSKRTINTDMDMKQSNTMASN
jgi:predicted metal-dependent HD superfamily phosphohydrolase